MKGEWNKNSIDGLYREESVCFEIPYYFDPERPVDSVVEFGYPCTVDPLTLLSDQGIKPGRLLDIGCSAGFFLARARKVGWAVAGLEPDPQAVEFARETFGLEVTEGFLGQADLPGNSFDVVTIFGALEHTPHPDLSLRQIGELLVPGGYLVVHLPNVRSLNYQATRLSATKWDQFHEPGHLFHFTPETMDRLLTGNGFIPLQRRTSTIMIRGKLPFLPWRWGTLERHILAAYRRYPVLFRLYRGMLLSIDNLGFGDTLMVLARKEN
jgi:SAM-dependent methyltransferase